VENAIKHGMDPEVGPLHIFIRTRETDYGNEIVVEDNGTGFSFPDDSNAHLALANIQQRLTLMCKGKMMILPREEGGTIVKILIP
jgi:sensor histidine kinase YesM